MPLLTSEVQRVRYELGINLLEVGSEPYISTQRVIDEIVQTYLQAGAETTSATAVTAATTATPATLTLASIANFTVGDEVVIDVDSRRESATIQSIAGSDVVVLLTLAHTGTYPVAVYGGLTQIRDILSKIKAVAGLLGTKAFTAAGLKQVDEIIFETGAKGSSLLESLKDARMYWRDELASAVGVPNFWRQKEGSSGGWSQTVELY